MASYSIAIAYTELTWKVTHHIGYSKYLVKF